MSTEEFVFLFSEDWNDYLTCIGLWASNQTEVTQIHILILGSG